MHMIYKDIFCNIFHLEKEKILYQDKDFFCINDIHPINVFHILIISKKHYKNFIDIMNDNLHINSMKFIEKLIKKFNINRFQIINNNEYKQLISHFHIHLISDKQYEINDDNIYLNNEESY